MTVVMEHVDGSGHIGYVGYGRHGSQSGLVILSVFCYFDNVLLSWALYYDHV